MTKIEIAKQVLSEGGYFRNALETGFRGREQFQTRLRNKDHKVVKGIGFQTWKAMSDAGMLTVRPCASSSTWPTEYVLFTAEVAA